MYNLELNTPLGAMDRSRQLLLGLQLKSTYFHMTTTLITKGADTLKVKLL